jgi:hypothetical protein
MICYKPSTFVLSSVPPRCSIIRPMAKRGLCLLILAVVVLCPFTANAAADFATEGMDDPELDAIRHVQVSLDGFVASLPPSGLAHLLVVVAVVEPVEETVPLPPLHLGLHSRAPPAS